MYGASTEQMVNPRLEVSWTIQLASKNRRISRVNVIDVELFWFYREPDVSSAEVILGWRPRSAAAEPARSQPSSSGTKQSPQTDSPPEGS